MLESWIASLLFLSNGQNGKWNETGRNPGTETSRLRGKGKDRLWGERLQQRDGVVFLHLIDVAAAVWNAQTDSLELMQGARVIYQSWRWLSRSLPTPLTFINSPLKTTSSYTNMHAHLCIQTKIYDRTGKLCRGERISTMTPRYIRIYYSKHGEARGVVEPDVIDAESLTAVLQF